MFFSRILKEIYRFIFSKKAKFFLKSADLNKCKIAKSNLLRTCLTTACPKQSGIAQEKSGKIMGLSVITNTTAASSSRMLNIIHAKTQDSLMRLSTGKRINKPSDDAGGLAVSTKISAAIRRNSAVQNNVSNAISMLQTQDGALETYGSILERMSELKMLSQDITKGDTDKNNYNTEFVQLKSQLANLKNETFNNVSLFGRALGAVAITEDGGQSVTLGTVTLEAFSAATLGDFDISTAKTQIENIATYRATNGASSNRLQYALDMLSINKVNLEAANGRILDTDIASESTQFAKLQILSQANSAMLSQANMLPQAALRLIQ